MTEVEYKPGYLDRMNLIVDKVYLGAERAATHETHKLKACGITHILTISKFRLDKKITQNFKYKFIFGIDMESTDLLSHFEECIAFIQDAVDNGGGVFIHCVVGCSRSATIVIAYLMNKNKAKCEETLTFVQSRRPIVGPNEGFLDQLHLYEEMGCVIDKNNEKYRKYKLEKFASKFQNASEEERSQLKDDFLRSNEVLDRAEDIVYKCRKCRIPLFKQSSVMKHFIGEGEIAFDWRGKISTEERHVPQKKLCDMSYFIEPVKWMHEVIQDLDGKLACPKCSCKIGSFIWYGERCPCGAWVAPAFHIQTGKIDACKPTV